MTDDSWLPKLGLALVEIRITNICCVFIVFVYYMEYVLTAFIRKQFIQTVRFIYSAIECGLIFINVRIEQRTSIVRQVETRHNLFISPNCVYRCMKTQFKGSMIISYRRVLKRDSLTRQN
jgi:hypothetical protein